MAPTRYERSKKPYNRPSPRPRASDGSWVHDMHDKAPAPQQSTHDAPTQQGNTRVMVTNLHYELTPKDLISVFGQVGTLVREPLIRYDRSGRSSGVAIITYELPGEAARAITQYNGATANGQMMTVEYDKPPPTRPKRRVVSAPSSLINRIQKAPLLERLGNSTSTAPSNTARKTHGPGPVRSKPPRAPRSGPKKVKTAEELDQELDSFMKDDAKVNGSKTVDVNTDTSGSAAVPASLPAVASAAMDTDVEMS